MRFGDVLARSALEQAALVRKRELSAEELVAASLARIVEAQPRLEAFAQIVEARARAQARRIDAAVRARDGTRVVFEGVPSAIKDADPVRGTFTRVGSRAYRFLWTPFDGPAAARLRRAGLVFCGKTTTSELTLMPVVETDLQPPTRNPWNLEHTSGGSSGGAAAAVAAGLLPLAHASDGAGSIRIPAAFCHLFGMKPSRALLPNFYERFEPLGLSAVGAVTHTVEDSAALLDALRGQVVHPAPAGTLLAGVRAGAPAGLRVAMCLDSPLVKVSPEVAAGVGAVAKAMESLGHRLEVVGPLGAEVEEFLPVFQRLAATPPVLFESSLQPITRWLRAPGRHVTLGEAREIRDRLTRRVLDWFGEADLALLPAVACVAPRVGAWRDCPPAEAFAGLSKLGAFTAAFNVSGQPAASVPAGVAPDTNLPFAAQIVGRPGADLVVLQVCRQLEAELAWGKRRSPMFADRSGGRG